MTNGKLALTAVAEPMRMTIVEQLGKRPMTVGELASRLPISRPAVSQHLKVLKDASLVQDKAEGTRRIYSLDRAGLGQIRQWLDRHWDRALTEFANTAERKEDE